MGLSPPKESASVPVGSAGTALTTNAGPWPPRNSYGQGPFREHQVTQPQGMQNSSTTRTIPPTPWARSLRTHMEPADLMELIYVLAEAAADVLREREERGRS